MSDELKGTAKPTGPQRQVVLSWGGKKPLAGVALADVSSGMHTDEFKAFAHDWMKAKGWTAACLCQHRDGTITISAFSPEAP